jgi:hypothetical protein
MDLLLKCIKYKHPEFLMYELEDRNFKVSIFDADELDHSLEVTLNKEQAKQMVQALTAYIEDLT